MSANVWKKCTIKGIAEVKDGTHSSYDRVESGEFLLSCKNVFDNELKIEKNESLISEEDYHDIISNGFPQKNDLLISCVGSIGRCCVFNLDKPIAFQRSVAFVRSSQVNSKFLMYRIQSEATQRQIRLSVNASAQGGIYLGSIERVKIIVPKNPEEQKHIADILSTCDTVIQNTQKTIDKYKAIKQGMMQDLFTRGLTKDGKLRPSYKEAPELYKESELGIIPKDWDISDFGDIGSLAMCKRVFQYETTDEGEIPFYKIGTFGANPDAYISKTLYESYRNLFSYPNKGDILISASGTIGRTVIFDGKPAYFQDSNIMWLAHDERRILNNYLYYLYKTITWNLEGSTIKRLYTDNFKKIKVSFPKDKLEQDEIAKRLSSIDSTIQKEETILAKYKKIKTGLMARLLTPPEDAEIINETGE